MQEIPLGLEKREWTKSPCSHGAFIWMRSIDQLMDDAIAQCISGTLLWKLLSN